MITAVMPDMRHALASKDENAGLCLDPPAEGGRGEDGKR
jgi:hypothetical protein